MNIWDEFENAKLKLFDFVNAKQVILWGYEYNGYFLEHLFKLANKKIEFIVDDGNINPRIQITRSCELVDLSPDKYAVIISGEYDKIIEEFLENKSFKKNKNYIYAKDVFLKSGQEKRNISYFGYLESHYDVDIIDRKPADLMEKPREDCLMYSPGIGYGLVNVLEEICVNSNDSVFDYGCGKGGALILFQKYGFNRYGGVEYDKQLFSVLNKNFDNLGLCKKGLINADATKLTFELDSYNYFFMYNPFIGETFIEVIQNIEASWERNKRKIIFIYSGPYCHEDVIKNGYFVLTKKIYTDYSVRNVNIYTISEEQ